ncbi:MAG: ATP-binding protein, partial [Desulfobulbaceae bacterium]|nr:ATP-binding protein [Desulfobulbaceae bacterium]
EHLPEYIIKTTGDKMLTLVNPEYLIRQVYELQSKKDGPLGHITSLDPIRAENLADQWESGALKAFENGISEFSEVQLINDQPYLRFMKPMITEQGCLQCHAVQGYELGDVRGGISVSIPLTPLEGIYAKTIIVYALVHLGLWLLGLIGIFYGASSISRSITRLQEAESNTRAVLENMMDGVITLDAKGNIASLNNAALTMFGYSMDSDRSMHMQDFLSDEDYYQAEYNELLSCLLEPERGDGPIRCHSRELEGRRNDGSLFPLEVNSNSMWMGTKRIVLMMVRDITERKKAQEVLLSSQKQAVRQEKLVSLGTMAAGIAHEIKNPAQAIAFSMEGLRMNVGYIKEFISSLDAYLADESAVGKKDKDNLREEYNKLRMDLVLKGVEDVVDRNVSSIERIDRIINSTKRMANSHEVFRPCDINAIIHDAAILTRNHVKYKARVDLNLADDLPRINGLSQDLGQVFINLILNAMDAIVEKGMSAKEGLIQIISRFDEESGRVEVSVTDNGMGIDPDNIGKIFDPFFSTKTVGQGMGLGLNICHRIIEAHGGEILVESTPGKGTVFTVRIDQVSQ